MILGGLAASIGLGLAVVGVTVATGGVALVVVGSALLGGGSAVALAGGLAQDQVGKEKIQAGKDAAGKGSSEIPSNPDGSINDEKTIGFKMPKQSIRDLLNTISAGKIGAGTQGGDFSMSDRTYMMIK